MFSLHFKFNKSLSRFLFDLCTAVSIITMDTATIHLHSLIPQVTPGIFVLIYF